MNNEFPTRAQRREKKKKQKMRMHGKATKRLAMHIARRAGSGR